MKLMSLKQYMKMSKPALIRKITKTLRAMPKVKLARMCYNITKSKLPRIKTDPYADMRKYRPKIFGYGALKGTKYEQKAIGFVKRKKKRKFSRKQLAAQRLFAKRARAGTLRKRRR